MASKRGDESRKPIEPLVSVVTDSVALGYEALELVLEGLRESLRLKSGGRFGGSPASTDSPAIGSGSGGRHSGARDSGRATSGALLRDFAEVAAELLGRAGAIAADVAGAAAANVPAERDEGPTVIERSVEAPAGGKGSTSISVINHGSTALGNIALSATDLVGAGRTPVKASAISFDPSTVSYVGPGKHHRVEITVNVPKGAAPGIYRGLVQAEPGDMCAVLMLHVKDAPAKRSSRRSS